MMGLVFGPICSSQPSPIGTSINSQTPTASMPPKFRMPPLSLPLQFFSLPSFALSPLLSKPSFHPPSIPSSPFSYRNLRIAAAAAAAADDDDHVIGDCLVFEDGAFEDPAPPGPAPARGGAAAPSAETLIPDRWKEAVEEMKLTKKEKRKISHGLRFASKLDRRRKSPAPAAEEYEAFRELKLSQLKPVVLDDPKEFRPPAEGEEVARRGRVAAVNPRLGMREGGLEDIREFFSSGEYVPGKILDDKKPKGPRKLFTQEEKTLLNKRIPNLGEATSSKWLPLHTLAASGEFYLLDALLKHNVDINAVDKDGLSAMHKAIFCKKQAIINYLLRNSANPHIRDKNGATLIHYAVQTASSQTIKILLLYDVDINLADNDGWTPLHLAVQAKRTDIVRLLLIKGADRTLKNEGGLTPLDLCLYSGHDVRTFELVKLLKGLSMSKSAP